MYRSLRSNCLIIKNFNYSTHRKKITNELNAIIHRIDYRYFKNDTNETFKMRLFICSLCILLITACSTTYPNQSVTGKTFPSISGQTLEQKNINIPKDFDDEFTLLLIGYKQNSQFDIDRWLIGLDMTKTNVAVYELPTIQGLFPRIFSAMIDNGMRAGIPHPLWKSVVTVYKDGDKIQVFTGNENPNNTRVILLNREGNILYFYDEGFSVLALNHLNLTLKANQ